MASSLMKCRSSSVRRARVGGLDLARPDAASRSAAERRPMEPTIVRLSQPQRVCRPVRAPKRFRTCSALVSTTRVHVIVLQASISAARARIRGSDSGSRDLDHLRTAPPRSPVELRIGAAVRGRDALPCKGTSLIDSRTSASGTDGALRRSRTARARKAPVAWGRAPHDGFCKDCRKVGQAERTVATNSAAVPTPVWTRRASRTARAAHELGEPLVRHRKLPSAGAWKRMPPRCATSSATLAQTGLEDRHVFWPADRIQRGAP